MASCANECKIQDQHIAECSGNCRGCLPRHTDRILCERCENNLANNLAEIRACWDDLHNAIGRSNSYELKERVAGTPEIGLVLNDAVMAVMSEVREWVVFVARVISSEDDMAQAPDSIETKALLSYVIRHFDFIKEHELAGDFAEDSWRLRGKVERNAYPSGSRRMKVQALCQVSTDEGICEGQLFAMLRSSDEKLPSAIYCKKDKSHKVDPSEWIELGKQIRGLA